MTDKADHIAWAAEAVAVFQRRCRTGDEHAIADLICDLGHLAEERASAAEIEIDTLADRLRDDAVANDGVIFLPRMVGAWARVA